MECEATSDPIILIGMSRSGTTVVASLLGQLPNVHFESEPQLLWKMGNFHYLGDRYDLRTDVAKEIRRRLLSAAGKCRLVEKSPQNCVRPDLVFAAFPDARLVYLERDPVRCIVSHLELRSHAASLWFQIKRYFGIGRRSKSSPLSRRSSARSQIADSIRRQLRLRDVPAFLLYSARMILLKYVSNSMPFGVKIDGFASLIRASGPVEYHVAALCKAVSLKGRFRALYGSRMQEFQLEELFADSEATQRLLNFCGFFPTSAELDDIRRTFDRKRVDKSSQSSARDIEVRNVLSSVECKGNGFNVL